MSDSRQPVIAGAARTPVGRLLGALSSKSATELGGVAIAAALQRAGVAPDRVEYVIMGQVLQAGAGQITARQAAVAAGIGMTVPALTVNKVCLSGLDAIALASQLIRLGEYDVVVAGGMESMTRAPHLLLNSRAGYKYGPVTVEDSMALDGLTDAFDHLSMGESTDGAGASSASPASSRTSSPPCPTSAPPRPPRTACSPPRSRASPYPARANSSP
jgi:Acetyl-CoA acetyltransferase